MEYHQAQTQPPSGYATSPNPAYAQQSTVPQSAVPRILHVYREGFTNRHILILDSDKRTPIYRIDANSGGLFSSKPHLRVHEAATNTEIATITFHSVSSDIDIVIRNRPILLSKPGVFKSAHEFQSPATGGSFEWKSDGIFSGGDMICLDDRKQLVARFEKSAWAMKKKGKFELSGGITGELMTEIVISGIARVEYISRRKSSSSAAAGVGVGGAAGAAC